jgi:hypothetical protein
MADELTGQRHEKGASLSESKQDEDRDVQTALEATGFPGTLAREGAGVCAARNERTGGHEPGFVVDGEDGQGSD